MCGVDSGTLHSASSNVYTLHDEGVQNRPPQNVLLWHADYFELKAVEILQVHEKLLPLPYRI